MRASRFLACLVLTTFVGCGGKSGRTVDTGDARTDVGASDAPLADGAPADRAVVDGGDDRDASVADAGFADVAADAAGPVDVSMEASVDVAMALADRPAEGSVPIARSYDVLVKITPAGGWLADGVPREHRMTMWIDPANDRVVAGVNGSVAVGPLQRGAGGTWVTSLREVEFNQSYETRCYGWGRFDYAELAFTSEGDRLTGTARGEALVVLIDVGHRVSFSGTVEGGPDITPPRVSVHHDPGGWETPSPISGYVRLRSSEPLAPGTRAYLLIGDQRRELRRDAKPDGTPIGSFYGDGAMSLPFDAVYPIVLDPPATDLAGQRGAEVPPLRAPSPPGHLTEDGFEGPVNAALTGSARVVEDDPSVAISGRRVVMIPAASNVAPGVTGRFTARLPVRPGETQVRATVRWLSETGVTRSQLRRMLVSASVAVPGSAEHRAVEISEPDPATWQRRPQGGMVGPPVPISLPIPPGATEVIFDVLQAEIDCHLTQEGLVIDDLRTE